MIKLEWHDYSYLPYERELASREVHSLTGGTLELGDGGLLVDTPLDAGKARRLTYFSRFGEGDASADTTQALIEATASSSRKRQSTRYSVHGLHEYKGKFNPQVAKALLNVFGLEAGERVLDPFCGSGTTLVEASRLGLRAAGTDLNPLAVFIANAKLLALRTPASRLEEALRKVRHLLDTAKAAPIGPATDRITYLRRWFTETTLEDIELLRRSIEAAAASLAPVFLTVASDLLRDHSMQDPEDLRIRRRESAPPDGFIIDRFLAESGKRLERVASAQRVDGTDVGSATAEIRSVTSLDPADSGGLFDGAVTSPPYAMALPYIDTQRLSLVWLDMIPPDQILKLEGSLVGSREMTTADRRETAQRLASDASELPAAQAAFCMQLQDALGDGDGFRRQAVPTLLHRYFGGMASAMASVRKVVKPGGRFGLVVGHNHTVLGGTRFDIDTPAHLAGLAEARGWAIDELMPLQTYKRYGYHATNAVAAETLVLLRNPPA